MIWNIVTRNDRHGSLFPLFFGSDGPLEFDFTSSELGAALLLPLSEDLLFLFQSTEF